MSDPTPNAIRPETAEAMQAVGNLLAIIHRDGGHYQAALGLKKAAEDAVEKVYEILAAPSPPPSAGSAEERLRKAAKNALETMQDLYDGHPDWSPLTLRKPMDELRDALAGK